MSDDILLEEISVFEFEKGRAQEIHHLDLLRSREIAGKERIDKDLLNTSLESLATVISRIGFLYGLVALTESWGSSNGLRIQVDRR